MIIVLIGFTGGLVQAVRSVSHNGKVDNKDLVKTVLSFADTYEGVHAVIGRHLNASYSSGVGLLQWLDAYVDKGEIDSLTKVSI